MCALCLAASSGVAGAEKGPSRARERFPKPDVQRVVSAWEWTQAVNMDLMLRTIAWDNAYVPPAPPPAPAPVVRSAPAPVVRPSRPSGGGGTSSGACGGATNGADAFIGRESGGNPNAHNPSGATGCFQIMPGTWAGSCSDLGAQQGASTQAQAACASRLPLSSWSSSGPTG